MIRRLLAAAAFALGAFACAALIDVKDLSAPSGPSEAGADGGSCAPRGVESLVPDLGVHSLAVDDTYVYFAHIVVGGPSQIMRCSKCGCAGQADVIVRGDFAPFAIAVDDQHVYWTDGNELAGGVHRSNKDGSDHVSFPASAPSGITFDADYVYFAAIGHSEKTGNITGEGIWRIAKSTFADGKPEHLLGRILAPISIAVDDTHIYWATAIELDQSSGTVGCRSANPDGGFAGLVERMPKGAIGGTRETLAANQACAVSLAVDAENVYFSTLGVSLSEGLIQKVPKSGGAVSLLANRQAGPIALTLADNMLFWASANVQGTILQCLLPGCTTKTPIATEEPSPGSVAVDRDAVYWGNQGNTTGKGSLRRAPR